MHIGSWFPHVPLALAIGIGGLLQLLPAFGSLQSLISVLPVPASDLSGLSVGFKALAIRGVSQELVGGLLTLLSIGLLWRSRLAWVLTLLMTAASLVMQLLLHSDPNTALVAYSVLLLISLLLTRQSFHRASLTIGTLFALVGILLTMGYGVLGSYVLGKGFSPAIGNFDAALYFTVVTMSTVGYGDITPHTDDARLFTMSLIVLGLVVFATSLTTIAGPVINRRMMSLLQPRKKHMKRTGHIIVAGQNALARNVVKSLEKRGTQVTAIWATAPQAGIEPPDDLIVGDATNSEVLESAGVSQARAVLALQDSDSDNAFVSLAAKDINPDVRTLLAVNDAHNMDRMRRVKPDAVLALPVIGAELVAMALSGEEIKTDHLLDQLLRLG
ncbi:MULTISPECIES: NAD-binding protein [unclassified Martelella]|uniref:NAD-binding protein n=1 Tax=unclassified Martelella TaxID=2629616 RepID=UPI0025C2BC16|nr:NAD-binding protein [Martelella sp.]